MATRDGADGGREWDDTEDFQAVHVSAADTPPINTVSTKRRAARLNTGKRTCFVFPAEDSLGLELEHDGAAESNGEPAAHVAEVHKEHAPLKHEIMEEATLEKSDIMDTYDMEDEYLTQPQYGAGRLAVDLQLPWRKRKEFPTAREIKMMEKHIIMKGQLRRMNEKIVYLPTSTIQLCNLDAGPPNTTLDMLATEVFDIFIRHMLQQAGGNLDTTRYWISITHPAQVDGKSFHLNHQTYDKADGHTLVNSIALQAQSNKEIAIDDRMVVHMKIFVDKPQSRLGGAGVLSDEILKKFGKKQCMVQGEGYCMPKALAIGIAFNEWRKNQDADSRNAWKRLIRKDRNGTPSIQEAAAVALLKEAGLDESKTRHDLPDLRALAATPSLHNYWIQVFGYNGVSATPILLAEENQKATSGYIGLFFAEGHYDTFIPNRGTWLKTCYCYGCAKLVPKHHRCVYTCRRCGVDGCCPDPLADKVFCRVCKITFGDKQCYDAHLISVGTHHANPFCKKYTKCTECGKIEKVRVGVTHVCHAHQYCPVCRTKVVTSRHNCAHAVPTADDHKKARRKQKKWQILVYDFETIVVEHPDSDDVNPPHHLVNVVAYKRMCDLCVDQETCPICPPNVSVLSYQDADKRPVLERFAEMLQSTTLSGAYVVAHNGGRYDHTLTLAELTRQTGVTPKLLTNGQTLISAEFKMDRHELHFRDSLHFMPMALAKMPAAFGFKDVVKGVFPYRLNHPTSYGKKWPTLPDRVYYEPDHMKEAQLQEFDAWYEAHKEEPFDFDVQVLLYAVDDVKVLHKAIASYINVCAKVMNGWNPFVQTMTLAGFVMHNLKHDHIQQGDVGHIPENGFPGRNNSRLALKYLLWLQHEDASLRLRTKLCGGEKEINIDQDKYYADGYDARTRTVYEVHGCYYHGCPKCFTDRKAHPGTSRDESFQELYDKTMYREGRLKEAGYTVNAVWECEISEMQRANAQMSKFFQNCRYTTNLLPREAMFGGRTQGFRVLTSEDEECVIRYLDFCSLYPYVNIMGRDYPRGQPQIITENFDEQIAKNGPVRGLVFCDVLPPRTLALPVLPYRTNGKLIFPLCRSCAEEKHQVRTCTHNDETQRVLTGTWCSDELELAVAKGYKIVRYHEAWHWSEDQWHRGGFFASFLKPLLKLKHEASGWPRPDMTDEEKRQHCAVIKKNEDIDIDEQNVAKNPALRSLAKLFLNSAWGKFAQNPDKTECALLSLDDGVAICNYFGCPGYRPQVFEFWGDKHVFVARAPIKDALKTSKFTNVVIGALTTSAARLRLYKAMDMVGADNIIYCDTDSVIFRQKRGEEPLKSLCGDALGMLTDEVPAGKRITEVVAVAPKVYGLKMMDGAGNIEYSVKAKGVTLNAISTRSVNYENMRRMMCGEVDKLESVRLKFKRGSTVLDPIISVKEKKRLQSVLDKGHMIDGRMVPYGFKLEG